MKIKALFLTVAVVIVSSCSSSKLKELTPDQKKADVYYGQGTTELVNKNYPQALVYLTQAKELNPKDSKIRNNLGMAYYFRNQHELAEKEMMAAIDLDQKNSDARLNLGALYMEKNKNKEARAQFEKVLEDLTFQAQYRNYYNLAIIALKEGDRRESFEYLAKAIREKDNYCPAYFKQGELYNEELRFKEALDSFKEATKGTCVTDPSPHYQQALALVNLNRPLEAKRKFQEIFEKFPTTRFGAMASAQIKKLSNINEEQQSTRATQTEVIKSQSGETPNF